MQNQDMTNQLLNKIKEISEIIDNHNVERNSIMEKEISLPITCELNVNKVFSKPFSLVINQGITTFVGPNGTGKTQTLKALRDYLRTNYVRNQIRYMSSNRIGLMEQFRSKTNQFSYKIEDYSMYISFLWLP